MNDELIAWLGLAATNLMAMTALVVACHALWAVKTLDEERKDK